LADNDGSDIVVDVTVSVAVLAAVDVATGTYVALDEVSTKGLQRKGDAFDAGTVTGTAMDRFSGGRSDPAYCRAPEPLT